MLICRTAARSMVNPIIRTRPPHSVAAHRAAHNIQIFRHINGCNESNQRSPQPDSNQPHARSLHKAMRSQALHSKSVARTQCSNFVLPKLFLIVAFRAGKGFVATGSGINTCNVIVQIPAHAPGTRAIAEGVNLF